MEPKLTWLALGFDNVLGFVEAGDLTELHQLTQLSVADLHSTLSRGGKPAILDVRSTGEWKSNGIRGSMNIPLDATCRARFRALFFQSTGSGLPGRISERRWRRVGSRQMASTAFNICSVE